MTVSRNGTRQSFTFLKDDGKHLFLSLKYKRGGGAPAETNLMCG